MRKIAILIIALMIGVGFLSGCQEKIGDKTDEKELSFETIMKGCGWGLSERKNIVITNESEWKDLLNNLGWSWSNSSLPEIDFTQNIIIAVFQGCFGTGGYSIEITQIVDNESTIEVIVKEKTPESGVFLTQAVSCPFHIVVTQKVDRDVVFKVD